MKGLVWEGKPRKSQEMKQTFPAVREAETGSGGQLLRPLEAGPAGSHGHFSLPSPALTQIVFQISKELDTMTSKNLLSGISQDSDRTREGRVCSQKQSSAGVQS